MLPENTKIIITKWDGWSGDMDGDPTGEVAYIWGASSAYELPDGGGRYYCRSSENASEFEIINKGEEEMTNEEVKNPEYIIIVKNTETYKKGGVLYRFANDYAPASLWSGVFHVEQHSSRISAAQAQVLLSKKIAVEAVRFNPEFVTLEQEALLTKTLADMNKKKPAVKKAPVKKGTK